jgi:hypothetical protein
MCCESSEAIQIASSELADVVDPNALTIGPPNGPITSLSISAYKLAASFSADGEPREWTAT